MKIKEINACKMILLKRNAIENNHNVHIQCKMYSVVLLTITEAELILTVNLSQHRLQCEGLGLS